MRQPLPERTALHAQRLCGLLHAASDGLRRQLRGLGRFDQSLRELLRLANCTPQREPGVLGRSAVVRV